MAALLLLTKIATSGQKDHSCSFGTFKQAPLPLIPKLEVTSSGGSSTARPVKMALF